jgi:transcriptional antiterminator RfaH
MLSWCVVHTQPLKELVAQKHLCEQGFSVYLPRFRKMRRHARKVEEVLAPLFPRYLFVGMDMEVARFHSINSTRGVSYLLMQKDRPAFVSTHVLDQLRQQEESDGVVSIGCLQLFTAGEKVRVTEGMFKDQVATFVSYTDQQRVQVLLQFLGRGLKVDVPLHTVEEA